MPDDDLTPQQHLLASTLNTPLVEADPKSLDELMARLHSIANKKPLTLLDSEIDEFVEFLRDKRGRFAQLAKEKESEPKRRSKRAETLIDYSDIEV